MQDNNNPQDQVLDNQGAQSEAEGLEAVKKATEAALEASGMNEIKNENPAVAEILEGVENGSEGTKETPKIVGLSDARQEVGSEAPVKDVETEKTEGVEEVPEKKEVAMEAGEAKKEPEDKVLAEVIKKIRDAENVLVALSNDPSVDEMAGAIGLSLALDMMGKHTTAIYSGKTPNVLEFLKPEETFEANANVLQDFVIALNKDKADHLRYKIEGEFVKVYVTPYKSLISEGDLEFSRGDYNVDLVIALNVPAATELDAALREYGRIMHDATSINITNEVAGKFGDVEWVDSKASSVSEMVARLVMELADEMDAGVATALLTGIVAATDKFANQATSPEVMMLAAKLMGYGANQQAVFKNISQKLEFKDRNDVLAEGEAPNVETKVVDTSKLTVGHNGFADSVEGGEMEKYVDLSADATPEAKGIVGLGDSRSEVGGEAVSEADEIENIADELKAQQAGYEEAVQDSSAQGRGGILGSVQSVLQSVMNKNSASGYEGSANGDTGNGAGFVVGEESAGTNSVVDEILSGLKDGGTGAPTLSPSESTSTVSAETNGMPDYGKMIDEALNEKMPGEEGAGVSSAQEVGTGAVQGGEAVGTPVAPTIPASPAGEAGSANGTSAEMPAVAQEVTGLEAQTSVPAEAQVSNEAATGASVKLPMPEDELGVPPAPVVADFNGLPQMPPVVDEGQSGAMNGAGAVPVEANGVAGSLQTQAPETTVPQVASAEPVNGGVTGAVETPSMQAPAPGATVDPGQFQIPGQ